MYERCEIMSLGKETKIGSKEFIEYILESKCDTYQSMCINLINDIKFYSESLDELLLDRLIQGVTPIRVNRPNCYFYIDNFLHALLSPTGTKGSYFLVPLTDNTYKFVTWLAMNPEHGEAIHKWTKLSKFKKLQKESLDE